MQFNEQTVLICDCGKAMIPNISTGDEEGYGWICLNRSCPEFNGAELASEDLEVLGVPSWVAELIANYFEHLEAEEATPKRPRLATYEVLTGTLYHVEATTEEEALNRFHDWYQNYWTPIEKQQFTDTVCEEWEARTVVIGHD